MYGGGEYVALTIANHLANDNDVDIIVHSNSNRELISKFFGINLEKVILEKISKNRTREWKRTDYNEEFNQN